MLPTLHVDLDGHISVGVFGKNPRSHKQHRRRGIAYLFVSSVSFHFHLKFSITFFSTNSRSKYYLEPLSHMDSMVGSCRCYYPNTRRCNKLSRADVLRLLCQHNGLSEFAWLIWCVAVPL